MTDHDIPAGVLAAVRARAVDALRPGDELAVVTDSDGPDSPERRPPYVLVAIARPAWSVVLVVDRREWNGLWLIEQMGFPPAPKPTAADRARRQLERAGA